MEKTILFIVILALATMKSAAAAPITFRFAYEDKDVYPYWTGDTTEIPTDSPGVLVECVLKIDELLPDITVQLSRYPWKRCQSMLQIGEIDGIIGSFTKERLEIGDYPIRDGAPDESRHLHIQSYSLYVRRSSNFSWDGKVFTNSGGKTVAVPRGYSIIDFIRKAGVSVNEVNDTPQGFQMLLFGRVDGLISLSLTAEKVFATLGGAQEGIIVSGKPIDTKYYYIIVSKQFHAAHPELTERIWLAEREVGEKYFFGIAKKY